MTNQEAINELQERIDLYEKNYAGTEPEYYEALRMSVIALEEQRQWIPVTERLPDDDNDVIVNKSDGIIDIAFWNGDVWRSLDSNYTLNVLAWMPLPEPYNPQN